VAQGWQGLLRERLEERPYATLALAAGAGYVLGGGVPVALMRVLFAVGGRVAIERALLRFAPPPRVSRPEPTPNGGQSPSQAIRTQKEI
jgi:hypothetical protein